MCNVYQESKSLQCAFLIDVNAENLLNEIKPLELSNAIRLCTLRILTYFCDKFGCGTSNLRWGYKFYNSRAITHLFERHEFKEFKAEYFEEFELDICKRLDESFDKESQIQNIQHGDVHELSGQKPSPSKCLNCALTDLIHDFEWERPDITSPFKRSGRASQTEDANNRNTNFVFLFTWCPCSKKLMTSFCNRSIKSCDDFRNVVLPTALFKKFCGNCNISLLWVDTGLWWWKVGQGLLEDWSCKLLVQEFTKSVRGCLIPLSALVNLEISLTRQANFAREVQSTDGTSDLSYCHGMTRCGILLPFASVMNHFLYQCNVELADLELKTSCSVIGVDTWTGLLCTAGNSDIVHCTVKLNPIFNENGLQTQECISNSTSAREDQAGVFWIQGVIKKQEFCPSWLHPAKSYSCIGFATSGPSFSGWFQDLMSALSKQNLLLVIDFPDPNNGLPLTGVIEPLTAISGVLNVTNPNAMLSVEKLLLWHGKRAVTAGNSLSGVDDLSIGDGQNVTAAKSAQSARKQIEKERRGVTKTNSIFSSSDLNPLHARRNSAASLSLLEELTSVSFQEEQDSGEDESDLVRQLQELYRKKRKGNSSGGRKRNKEQKSCTESNSVGERKNHQKQNSRNKTGSSKERTKKQKSSSPSSRSCTDVEVEMEVEMEHQQNVVNESQEEKKELELVEFDDKNELLKYLKAQYNTVIMQNVEQTPPDTAQQLIKTTEHFLKHRFPDDFKAESSLTIKDNLLTSHYNLREKYENQESDEAKQAKLKEYHLQVQLRVELAAACQTLSAEDQLVDEVTVMLRTISFLKDPEFLSTYLRDELWKRYGKLIPKFVRGVYEGLMQDPPSELLSPSERSDLEESPVRSAKQPSVAAQNSQEPRSEDNRRFTRHRSVGDLRKRREIVVPGPSQKQVKQATKKAKKESPKTPVKKVRRNLFTDEDVGGQPSQVQADGGEKERSNVGRRHSVAVSGPLKTVHETPARKQIANALWGRQHRARRRANTLSSVEVVQESPLKQLQEAECLPRRSPRRHKASVKFQRSHSFYGRSASAKLITRTKSLTATSVRDSPSKKPEVDNVTDEQAEQNSPRLEVDCNDAKNTPVKTLRSKTQIVSPLRFSPRLRKRFSLHSLLKTTMDTTGSERAPSGKEKLKMKTPEKKRLMKLRSSPRLLKKRSFSCIGFTSTGPLKGREKRREANELPKNESSSSYQHPQNTPQKGLQAALSNPQNGVSSKFISINPMQPSTLENVSSPDDIVSFITPVKQLARSPALSSTTCGENNETQSSNKSPARLQKKLSERGADDSGELTIVKDIFETSSLPRSSQKRTGPSTKNDNVDNTSDALSPNKSRKVSCKQIATHGDVLPMRTDCFLKRTPLKATDPNTKRGSYSKTEEVALLDNSTGAVHSPSKPKAIETRNDQHSPSERTVFTKSPLSSNSCNVLATKTINAEKFETEKLQLKQSSKKSTCSVVSPFSENALRNAESCATDVLKLCDDSSNSPKQIKTKASRRKALSTPPMKRRRVNCSLSSPSEKKRLSPLNQILKQRKPKPEFFSKSPTDKITPRSLDLLHSGLSGSSDITFQGTRVKRKRFLEPIATPTKRKRKTTFNNSKSSHESDDILDGIGNDQNSSVVWDEDILCLDRIDIEKRSPTISPLSGKPQIDKSVVFGGKDFKRPQSARVSFSGSSSKDRRRSSDAFDADPDDDVFLSLVPVSFPHRRTKLPSTPVSLTSLKQLQESPILYGAQKSIFSTSPSKFRISPSSLTRKWAEVSPETKRNSKNVPQRLRKQTIEKTSELNESENDILLGDFQERHNDSGTKRKSNCSLKLTKRLRLSNSNQC